MSEHLFRFLLSELKVIRVRCLNCRAVIETPIEAIGGILAEFRCPFCKKFFAAIPTDQTPYMGRLAELFEALAAMNANVEIEFTLPQEPS